MQNAFFSRWVLLLVGVTLFSASAEAARFANQFIEFELPPKWQCVLEGAEWICQNEDPEKKREAIIILAAKLRGDQDSLDQYQKLLNEPKSFTSIQNKLVKSDRKYSKMIQLNDHSWVDALHLESEIPGYYTRYLATIKEDIGVLVTYSINKDKYAQYLNDFENLVKTLRVFRKSGGLNAAPADSNLFANTSIPSSISETSVFPTRGQQTGGGQASGADGDGSSLLWLVLGVGVIGFVIWRRRRGM